MSSTNNVLSRQNFFRAHGRARRHELIARLSGKPTSLLPFEVLASILKGYQRVPLPDTEMIPLDQIVGSVGRYNDFTRDFLPKHYSMLDRWVRVEQAMESLEGTPPIEVYRVGDVYFVADGNHRVSVARAAGLDALEARVFDIPGAIDLEPGDTLDEAIIKAERARFLAETRLAERVPVVDMYLTRPRGFTTLLELVRLHQRLLSDERGSEVTLEDAAEDWHRTSYLPTIETIRNRHLLRRFPNRTAADLYVWIWKYIVETYQRAGEKVPPEEAVAALESTAFSPLKQAVQALMERIAEVSRSFVSDAERIPDWIAQTHEWNDGSLSQLAETSREAHDDDRAG